jgi:hypothetical protein
MLNQLISTLSALCGFFITLILLNYVGLNEHLNLLISTTLFSAIFPLLVMNNKFYWVSGLFLLSLVLVMQVYHFLPWVFSGLGLGLVITPVLRFAKQTIKEFISQYTQTQQRINHYSRSFRPQHQRNSDHV